MCINRDQYIKEKERFLRSKEKEAMKNVQELSTDRKIELNCKEE